MKRIHAELLMLIVTIFWGSSYLFMAVGLDRLGIFNMIALRFGFAFIIAGLLLFKSFKKVTKATMFYSYILGILLFVIFSMVMIALKTTTTTNVGFLVSLTVIFVPMLNVILFKERIERRLAISIVLALIGLGLMTIRLPFHMSYGDILCILAAFLYAVHILVVNKATKNDQVSLLQIGILQLGVAGLVAFIFTLIFEAPTLPNSVDGWIGILILSIICSALGFIAQTIAQKYTTPERLGLIVSLEPLFVAIVGFVFAHEILSFREYLGGFILIGSVFLASVQFKNLRRKTA